MTQPSLQVKGIGGVSTRSALNVDIFNATGFGEIAESRYGILGDAESGKKQTSGNIHAKQNVRALNVSKVPRMSGGSASGDTQPLSQWVYDEYTMRNKGSDGVVENSTRDTGTLHTLHTGQPGHVNILAVFEQPDLSDGEGSDGAQEDGIPETTQNEVTTELFPEHKRFQVPKTPATNGKKRDYRGEILKSGGTTPRLPINPFRHAENTAAMGLSQAFRATQAGTSPMANLLPSDVPSTRPSPAFNQQHRPSTAGSLSSPAIMRHTSIQRATTEPQSRYVSMQESQAERRKRLQGQSTSSPIDKRHCDWGFSDDELDIIEKRAQEREKQRKTEAEAKRQFAKMAEAPAPGANTSPHRLKLLRQREPSSPTLRKANEISLAKPPIVEPIDLTTDNLTEDETERENDPEEPDESSDDLDELVDDDKENAGRQRVHIVTPKSKRGGPRTIIAYSSPEMRHKAPPSPVIQEEVDELDADMFPPPFSQPKLPVTIADSQSSQKLPAHKKRRVSESEQLQTRISSPTSRTIIPQSQAILHTSQLDSSMKRHLSGPSPLFIAPKTTDNGSPNSNRTSPRFLKKPPQVDTGEEFHKAPLAYGSSPPAPMAPPILPVSEKLVNSLDQEHDRSEDPGLTHEQGLSPSYISEKSNPKPVSNTIPTASSTAHPATLRSTIPETSSVARHAAAHSIDNRQYSNHIEGDPEIPLQLPISSRETNSKASTGFETANTHLTTSPKRASNQQTSQMSKGSRSPVSPAFTRIRKFNDIASDPTPPDVVGDMDVDINLITGDDLEFQSLIDGSSPIGPAMKRRRRTYGRRTESDVRKRFTASSEVASSPAAEGVEATTAGNVGANVMSSSEQQARGAVQADQANRQEEKRDGDRPDRRPSSHNEVEVATQIHHPLVAFNSEEESKTVKPHDQVNTPVPATNGVSASLASLSAKTTTIASRRAKRKSQDLDSEKDVDELSQPEARRALSLTSREKPAAVGSNIPNAPSPASATTTKMVAPTRVLAHFNASVPSFYPATCLYILKGDTERLKVRFDDGASVELHSNLVKRFELRPGDLVKLDRPGARAQIYVVQSVQSGGATLPPSPNPITPSKRRDLTANGTNKDLKTDIFGNTTVTVSLKQNSTKLTSASSTTSETVPIDSIYLPQSLFKKLKDRAYIHPAQTTTAPVLTPSDFSSAPSTPASRTRRNRASHSSFDGPPSTSDSTHSHSGLFGNMVFGITNIPDQKHRSFLVKSIFANGGTVLESQHGFRELFVLDTSSTPSEFALTPNAQGKGFTALLADRHCRNAKYIQALALGIPCLSPRWVQDCLTSNELLAWEPYLLASGESSFLHGAVRSRFLPSYAPENTSLQGVISYRPQFLSNQNILLLIGNCAEIMQNYPLIARALGARKVDKAITVDEAREKLREDNYDWVYFHEGESREKDKKSSISEREKRTGTDKKFTVEEIEGTLFGKGKKRKRGSKDDEEVAREGTRVVTTEFVVQSLILGSLLPGR